MSTPPLLNPSLQILIWRQSPLLTWRELPRKWPGNSKSRPDFKGNNSIWFELSKNLLTPLSKCCHNYLRRKRNRMLKLLPRSPRANRRRERERSSSANTESEEHSNSEPSKSSTQAKDNSENESGLSKRMSKLEQHFEALANRGGLQDVGIIRPN